MDMSVTCYTIISRDKSLLEWCVTNARDRAGMNHEWLVIGWDPEPQIVQWCKEHKVRLVEYNPKPESDFPNRTAWFLHNLYACWNLGYEHARTKWVVRMGSDQFFSQGWLAKLFEGVAAIAGREEDRTEESVAAAENMIYHCHTTEDDIAVNSRHETYEWGNRPETFNVQEFNLYANDRIVRYAHQPLIPGPMCDLYYTHPSRGLQIRPDGCTWLQTKLLWEKYGPISDVLNVEGVTGDVSFMDKMDDAGVRSWLVPSSCTHHLVRGESRDIQQ